jgi:hypothetical protein
MKYYVLLILVIVTGVARADAASTTAVADKLWATDLPAFLNDHPRDHWIVGRSDQPALSAAEAETAARRDAAQQIADVLGASRYGRMSAGSITAAIERGSWIVDRQIDATERPYGTIWRAAILVDADPKALDALATRMQDARFRQRAHVAVGVVGGVVWLMAVSFGYMVLNWLTRGYFRGRLALVSVVMIAAGVVAIAQAV